MSDTDSINLLCLLSNESSPQHGVSLNNPKRKYVLIAVSNKGYQRLMKLMRKQGQLREESKNKENLKHVYFSCCVFNMRTNIYQP